MPPTFNPARFQALFEEVRGQGSARRTFHAVLGAVAPDEQVDALRKHRTEQRKERLKAGADWVDSGGLVFTTYALRGAGQKVGRPLHPRNVLRVLHDLLTAVKLPKCRFHDLRHSAASLLIASGVELVEVSQRLGHSELRITADLYSHLQKQTAVRAARQMDALFAPPKS